MLVLQENRGAWPKQHFAFTVDAADLDAAAKVLASREVVTTGPVHHAWIPGRSLYFSDPDDHELELFAATPA
jgi:hypothetical protein